MDMGELAKRKRTVEHTTLYKTMTNYDFNIIHALRHVTIYINCITTGGHDISVGIATRYGLYGPGIEFRVCGRGSRFSAPVQTGPWGPTQSPAEWVPGLSWGVKRPGRGANHPPTSSAEVKEGVAIHLFPNWVIVVCYRVTFTFTFDTIIRYSDIQCVDELQGGIRQMRIYPWPVTSQMFDYVTNTMFCFMFNHLTV
jgi:hypothetical protein